MPLGSDTQIWEIPPEGMSPSRKVLDSSYREGVSDNWKMSRIHGGPVVSYRPCLDAHYLAWRKLHWLDARRRQLSLWGSPSEEEERGYSLPLVEVFHRAAAEAPSISVDQNTMAGAPCVAGTRIPVYGILDAIEDHGTFEGVIRSYPRLTLQQIKDAVLFAKLVVECPVGE